MTAVQGDGAGFPDLFMVNAESGMVAYAIELKQDGKYPSPAQRQWLDDLDACGIFTAVWRPKDWQDGTIERLLRAGEKKAA
jgi:hypothetical protein